MTANAQLLARLYDYIGFVPGTHVPADEQLRVNLCEKIAADARFANHAPDEVTRVLNAIIANNGEHNPVKAVETAHSMLDRPMRFDHAPEEIIAQLKAEPVQPTPPAPHARRILHARKSANSAAYEAAVAEGGFVSTLKRTRERWTAAPTQAKVSAGIMGAGAILGAFGSINTLRHAVAKDENGETHVAWSNVAIGLVQATLAAGCAYLAAQAVRGGHAH